MRLFCKTDRTTSIIWKRTVIAARYENTLVRCNRFCCCARVVFPMQKCSGTPCGSQDNWRCDQIKQENSDERTECAWKSSIAKRNSALVGFCSGCAILLRDRYNFSLVICNGCISCIGRISAEDLLNLSFLCRGKSAAAIVSAVMFCEVPSTSANTGVAPRMLTQLADAMKDRLGTMTSSPRPMPSTYKANSKVRECHRQQQWRALN